VNSLSKKIKVTTIAGMSMTLLIAGWWTTGAAIVPSTSASDTGVSRSRMGMTRGATYADGAYTAIGKYGGRPSSIGVTVTLVDGVITAVEVTPHATDPTSLDFQRRFAAAIPTVVVGKPIDQVKVGRLAGSSGTPRGFNAAIQRIQEQARIGRTRQ
jgi:uncharacterized protein with FMN-binding domain